MLAKNNILSHVYSLLTADAISTIITGSICKMQRPTASVLEDCVINIITGQGTRFLQTGALNINIFFKDIIQGQTEFCNEERGEVLQQALFDFLPTLFNDNYIYFDQNGKNTDIVANEENHEHYANIQVNYKLISSRISLLDLLFIISDSNGLLEDALINANGTIKYTDASGESTFNFDKELVNYLVSKAGYTTVSGSIDLTENTTKEITLSIADTYSALFHVLEEGAASENAAVLVNGITQYTDSSGETTFTGLPNDTYSYTITKAGYTTINDSFTINDSDVDVDADLQVPVISYSALFTVASGVLLLEDALVALEGQTSQLTNIDGEATFGCLCNDTYDYTITKAGYITITGSITVSGADVTEPIEMVADTAVDLMYLRRELDDAQVWYTGTELTDGTAEAWATSTDAYGVEIEVEGTEDNFTQSVVARQMEYDFTKKALCTNDERRRFSRTITPNQDFYREFEIEWNSFAGADYLWSIVPSEGSGSADDLVLYVAIDKISLYYNDNYVQSSVTLTLGIKHKIEIWNDIANGTMNISVDGVVTSKVATYTPLYTVESWGSTYSLTAASDTCWNYYEHKVYSTGVLLSKWEIPQI